MPKQKDIVWHSFWLHRQQKNSTASLQSYERLFLSFRCESDSMHLRLRVVDSSVGFRTFFDSVSFRLLRDAAKVIQENHYYPFGQNMVGIEELDQQSLSSQEEQKFQYNAKEKLDEFGLYWNDHGARNLDLQTGRWTCVDPLAEKFSPMSPYVAMGNNPVMYVDLDGRLPLPVYGAIIGGFGGLAYGLIAGKSLEETTALTLGGAVTGATLGLGYAAIAALGGVEAIGAASASYIMLGTGVAGGLIGNASEQAVKMGTGHSQSFNEDEFVISGVFGMTELILGPSGRAGADMVSGLFEKSAIEAFKQPTRSVVRQSERQVATQLRGLSGNEMSKKQAKQEAKKIIKMAQERNVSKLEGIIKVSKNGVEVSISAIQTTVSEESKSKILEDGTKK